MHTAQPKVAEYVRAIQNHRDLLTDKDITTLSVMKSSLKNNVPLEPVWMHAAEQMIRQFSAHD